MKEKKDLDSKLLAIYINWEVILGSIAGVFVHFMNGDEKYVTYLNIIFLLFFCSVMLIKSLLKSVKGMEYIIAIIFSWIILYTLTLIINLNIMIIFKKTVFYTVTKVFIPIFLLLQIRDIEKLERAFIPYIYWGCVYSIIQYLVYNKTNQYDMGFSYSIVILTLISGILVIRQHKFKYLIPFLILCIVNLRVGSRGSLLCFGIALIFIFFIFKDLKKILMNTYFFILASIILLFNLKNIFDLLLYFFPSSRTIQLFAEGDFFYLSGRNHYYSFLLKVIYETPIKFRGLYSDRIYLAEYFNRKTVDEIYGSYSHNFLLEILFQFGILGIPIIILGVIMIIKSIKIVKNSNNDSLKNLYIVFASYCIGQLLFSSSYLVAPSFGLYAGIILWMYINKKKYKNEVISLKDKGI